MNKKDFDSVDFDADFLSDVSLEKLKKGDAKTRVNASLMTDVEAVVYEGKGIEEDMLYVNGNDDGIVNTNSEDEIDSDELQNKLSKELDDKIKSQSAEKTLYASSNENFMGSIYEEADQASEDFVNDLISSMPTSEEYDMQVHEYENDEEYIERTDTINHSKRTEKASFLSSLTKMFVNIFNFNGYASSSEYWFGILWIVVFNLIAGAANFIGVGWIASSIVFLLFFFPYMSLTCRRFNDVGLNSSNTMFATLMQNLGILSINAVNVFLNIKIMNSYTNSLNIESFNINLLFVILLIAVAGLLAVILLIMTITFVSSKENAYKGKTIQMMFYTVLSGGFAALTIAASALVLLPMLGII